MDGDGMELGLEASVESGGDLFVMLCVGVGQLSEFGLLLVS